MGLFELPHPTPTLTPTNAAMEVNGSLFNVMDHTVVSASPFVVNAQTLRNCNLSEGDGQTLGLVFQYEDPLTGSGFYTHIYDVLTNEDNRWPAFTWNRTDMSTNPTSCPIVPLDVETHGIAGRIVDPQNASQVNPGAYYELLMTFETLYEQVFTDRTTDPSNPVEILRGQSTPPFIDSKFTYNGVDQWIHSIGYWADPSCLPAPLGQMNSRAGGPLEAPMTSMLQASLSEDVRFSDDLMQRPGSIFAR